MGGRLEGRKGREKWNWIIISKIDRKVLFHHGKCLLCKIRTGILAPDAMQKVRLRACVSDLSRDKGILMHDDHPSAYQQAPAAYQRSPAAYQWAPRHSKRHFSKQNETKTNKPSSPGRITAKADVFFLHRVHTWSCIPVDLKTCS